MSSKQKLISALASNNAVGFAILRGGSGTLLVKLAGSFASLAATIILARWLEPAGFGVYSFVLAWVSILAIPAQFGLPTLVTRETAKAVAIGSLEGIVSLWRWATRRALTYSALIMAGVAVLLLAFPDFVNSSKTLTIVCGISLVPLIAVAKIRGGSLSGLNHVVLGQLPDVLIRPGLFVLIMIIAVTNPLLFDPTPAVAMAIHVIAAIVSVLFAIFFLVRVQPAAEAPATNYETIPVSFGKAAITLGLLSGAQLVVQHTDVIMIGLITNDTDVGIYRAILSASSVVAFGLTAINIAVAPHFARLFATNDSSSLHQAAKIAARVSLFAAMPIVGIMFFWGEKVVSILFGPLFSAGSIPLQILVLAQLFSAVVGPAGVLLNMTGNEKETLQGVAIGASVNILMNLVLIPKYGIIGAAIATGMSLIVWNILLWRSAWSKIGINCSAISFK